MPIGAGPVVLSVVGDTFIQPARIAAILWVGSSTAGDTAELRDPVTNGLLWPGRTDSTNTYLGAVIQVPAPNGFKAAKLDSGKLHVYLAEG